MCTVAKGDEAFELATVNCLKENQKKLRLIFVKINGQLKFAAILVQVNCAKL